VVEFANKTFWLPLLLKITRNKKRNHPLLQHLLLSHKSLDQLNQPLQLTHQNVVQPKRLPAFAGSSQIAWLSRSRLQHSLRRSTKSIGRGLAACVTESKSASDLKTVPTLHPWRSAPRQPLKLCGRTLHRIRSTILPPRKLPTTTPKILVLLSILTAVFWYR